MGALPTRSDLMVSLGFAAGALVEAGLTPPMGLWDSGRIGESAGAVLISGCFAFRRRYPVWSALLVMLLLSGVSLAWTDGRVWEIAAVMLASYSCARHATRAGAWVGLAGAAAFGLFVTSLEDNDDA